MVLVLRFELRLNLVRASGLLAIDCRFELHIPNKSIKTGALTIELDERGEIKYSPILHLYIVLFLVFFEEGCKHRTIFLWHYQKPHIYDQYK